MILLLQCPKCRNQMKYQSQDNILTKKRKVCVYCGFSFKARENIIEKNKSDKIFSNPKILDFQTLQA